MINKVSSFAFGSNASRIFVAFFLVSIVLGQGGGGGGGVGSGSGGGGSGGGFGGGTGGSAKWNQADTILVSCIFGVMLFCILFFFLNIFCCKDQTANLKYFRENYLANRTQIMSEQQFDNCTNNFIALVRGVVDSTHRFSYEQKTFERDVEINSIRVTKIDICNCEILLEGEDHFGKWNAEGNLFTRQSGLCLWFLKVYKDRGKAGQTGNWWNLLYESDCIGSQLLYGRWFYQKYPDSPEYSGRWKIERKSFTPVHRYY